MRNNIDQKVLLISENSPYKPKRREWKSGQFLSVRKRISCCVKLSRSTFNCSEQCRILNIASYKNINYKLADTRLHVTVTSTSSARQFGNKVSHLLCVLLSHIIDHNMADVHFLETMAPWWLQEPGGAVINFSAWQHEKRLSYTILSN